jgi:hypothetical protein
MPASESYRSRWVPATDDQLLRPHERTPKGLDLQAHPSVSIYMTYSASPPPVTHVLFCRFQLLCNGQNLALQSVIMVSKFIEVVDAALAAKQEAARSYSKEEWQQQKHIIDRLYRIERQSTGFVQKALQERGFHVK